MGKFKKIKTPDSVINEIQNNIEAVLLSADPPRQMLTSIKLTSGTTNRISHGLGRNLTGWIIVRKRGQSDIWDTQDQNTSPKLVLFLRCSVSVVVDIEVF
jgi:hypothetical protein